MSHSTIIHGINTWFKLMCSWIHWTDLYNYWIFFFCHWYSWNVCCNQATNFYYLCIFFFSRTPHFSVEFSIACVFSIACFFLIYFLFLSQHLLAVCLTCKMVKTTIKKPFCIINESFIVWALCSELVIILPS